MSAFENILTILGWCLLDSIWQLGIMWMAYKMFTAGNKQISPAGKHNLILLFVFIGTEWFIYSFIHFLHEPPGRFLPGFIPVSKVVDQWISWVSLLYLIILAGRLFQYVSQYIRGGKNENSKSLSPVFQILANRYSKILGIRRKVQVYVCTLAETAETSRFFKPVILLPVSLITHLSTQQIEAILVHELYHIRRNDYLINICMSCFRGIFFFNPFAHFFYKELARERELACDDGVLELGFKSHLYAEALFSLEKFRQPAKGFSLAADGNKPWLLMERIKRVLGKPETRQNRFGSLIIVSTLIAVSLFIFRPAVTVPGKPSLVAAIQRVNVKPHLYELTELKKSEEVKAPKPKINEKHLKIEPIPDIEPSPVAETEESPDPPDMAYYADSKIQRDYSNQPAADLTQVAVLMQSGTPYIPSGSLSYEAQPVIIAADSIRDLLIENDKRTVVSLSNLKTIASLKELEIEIDKNKQELSRIEIENQKLFLLDQRNVKPLLKNLQKQIESKKLQIYILRNKLEVSEAEIIHI
jgi:hypothetical protein